MALILQKRRKLHANELCPDTKTLPRKKFIWNWKFLQSSLPLLMKLCRGKWRFLREKRKQLSLIPGLIRPQSEEPDTEG